MLKIPAEGDTPPPLVVAVRRMPSEIPAADAHSGKRHKGRRKHGEAGAWEQDPAPKDGGRGERRHMRLMLVGGGLLLALILTGTVISMKSAKRVVPVIAKKITPPVGPATEMEAETAAGSDLALKNVAFLAEAEPLARKFLTAATVDEMAALVRNPAITVPRMKAFYPDGKVEPVGMVRFHVGNRVTRQGKSASVVVRTLDQKTRPIAFAETANGLRIDWESWSGWSEIPWPEFISKRSTRPHVFRLTLSMGEYYNFAFSDDQKWQSYRLESPDREIGIFGYVEKGSAMDLRLRPYSEQRKLTFMLALKFPEGATTANQVEIVKIISQGWFAEDTP